MTGGLNLRMDWGGVVLGIVDISCCSVSDELPVDEDDSDFDLLFSELFSAAESLLLPDELCSPDSDVFLPISCSG